MNKQTILRKAAKLILDPEFQYDWYKTGRCILGAMYQIITGNPYTGRNFCWGGNARHFMSGNGSPANSAALNAAFGPLLGAGFSLSDLANAEMMKDPKIAARASKNHGYYLIKEDAAAYLVAWADLLSRK